MNNEHEKYTITSGQEVSPEKLRTAREFRKNPTQAEANAWEWLRDRRCLGLKFRRQQVVHGFIVDFYCVELRLVLELDGGIHDDALDYDRDRDEVFKQMGIEVVRVRNEDCTQEKLTELVEEVLGSLQALEDVRLGNVTKCESAEELFKKLEIEV